MTDFRAGGGLVERGGVVTIARRATHPDATVICREAELDPQDVQRHAVVNPTLLVEVTSKSTKLRARAKISEVKIGRNLA